MRDDPMDMLTDEAKAAAREAIDQAIEREFIGGHAGRDLLKEAADDQLIARGIRLPEEPIAFNAGETMLTETEVQFLTAVGMVIQAPFYAELRAGSGDGIRPVAIGAAIGALAPMPSDPDAMPLIDVPALNELMEKASKGLEVLGWDLGCSASQVILLAYLGPDADAQRLIKRLHKVSRSDAVLEGCHYAEMDLVRFAWAV